MPNAKKVVTTTTTTVTTESVDEAATHIICVLDRSGSMSHLADEVITHFNHFLKTQQAEKGEAKLTLVLFDNQYELLYDAIDLASAVPLTSETYYVRGMTAMNDAVGCVLTANQNEEKAIVLIHTDGMENASREFTPASVKALVDKLESTWEFIFVGANIDAQRTGDQYGFVNNIQSNATAEAMGYSYDQFAQTTSSYRSVGKNAEVMAGIVAEANATQAKT
tara:strand:+ start:184 stop:849 length:666 start_codon:yes stop_codon:yes gene_type:complete